MTRLVSKLHHPSQGDLLALPALASRLVWLPTRYRPNGAPAETAVWVTDATGVADVRVRTVVPTTAAERFLKLLSAQKPVSLPPILRVSGSAEDPKLDSDFEPSDIERTDRQSQHAESLTLRAGQFREIHVYRLVQALSSRHGSDLMRCAESAELQ